MKWNTILNESTSGADASVLMPRCCAQCKSDFRLYNVWPPRYVPMHEEPAVGQL